MTECPQQLEGRRLLARLPKFRRDMTYDGSDCLFLS
jgi:hypothetical protein